MANEFTIKSQITLTNGTMRHTGAPSSFQANQTTKFGPVPGTVSATTSGVTVSLSGITTPGIFSIQNLDTTNYVSFGLYISSTYYPLGEVLPGEIYVCRFARDILTANSAAAVLRVKADTATCKVNILAFDK